MCHCYKFKDRAHQIFEYICISLVGDGYYAYIDSSEGEGDSKAVLESPHLQSASGVVCFMFAYHMYGSEIGQLNVNVSTIDKQHTKHSHR